MFFREHLLPFCLSDEDAQQSGSWAESERPPPPVFAEGDLEEDSESYGLPALCSRPRSKAQ